MVESPGDKHNAFRGDQVPDALVPSVASMGDFIAKLEWFLELNEKHYRTMVDVEVNPKFL